MIYPDDVTIKADLLGAVGIEVEDHAPSSQDAIMEAYKLGWSYRDDAEDTRLLVLRDTVRSVAIELIKIRVKRGSWNPGQILLAACSRSKRY